MKPKRIYESITELSKENLWLKDGSLKQFTPKGWKGIRSNSYVVSSYDELFQGDWEEVDIITTKIPHQVERQSAFVVDSHIYVYTYNSSPYIFVNPDKINFNQYGQDKRI